MEDITPKLLESIQNDFQRNFNKSEKISRLYKKVRDGTATYEEANEFAIETGEILAAAYVNNISADVLPDGKMYYNIAQRILEPTLENNYELITDVTEQVQAALNKRAGIGIKAQVPAINKDRIRGIVNKVSDSDNFADVEWMLKEPIINFSQSIVDDSIRTNAEFQSKLGMKPVITRKVAGNCCDWCKALSGTYAYPEDVPDNLYRRHRYCRCTVIYDPKDGKGKVQDSHSKKWRSAEQNDKIEQRKRVGLGQDFRSRTANMPPEEYARAVDLWRKVKEYPGLSGQEKEMVYEEFDNNLTAEEKESAIVSRPIGNYWYYAVNKGHNQYKIYEKRPIEPAKDIVDEVLSEMFGPNWREMLGE